MEIFSITSFTKEISRIDLIGILVGHLVFAIALTQILDWTWLKNLMSEEDKLKMLNSYTSVSYTHLTLPTILLV